MPVSDGIITAPVSVSDTAAALGVSSYDVGTLCSNASKKTRMLSIYKPTRKDGPVTVNAETGPLNDDWYSGVSCYGVRKPTVNIPKALWGGILGGQGKLFNFPAAVLVKEKWKYDSPILGQNYSRLHDFNGYKHLSDTFTNSGSSYPFKASIINASEPGTTALTVSAIIRYDMENVGTTSGSLGISSLFNTEYDDSLYFGILAYAPTKTDSLTPDTNRSDPLCLMAISPTKLGSYDATTGSRIMIATTTNTVTCIGGAAASPSSKLFYKGETIYLIPFLAKAKANSYDCMSLYTDRNNPAVTYKIGGDVPSVGSRATVTSATCTLTCLKNEDGSLRFYIASSADLRINCSSTGEYITFTGTYSINAGDEYTTEILANAGVWEGTSDPDVSGGYRHVLLNSRSVSPESINGWSLNVNPSSRPPGVTLKPHTTTTYFIVEISFQYWYSSVRIWSGRAIVDVSKLSSGDRFAVTLWPNNE